MMTLNVAIATTLFAALVGIGTQNARESTETPFFCNVKALTAVERAEHQQVTARLLAAITAVHEVPEGYAFEIGSALSMKDLATWVDSERRCCPFFDFHLEWRRENGPVTLRLTGRDGVKAFIRAEFASAFRG